MMYFGVLLLLGGIVAQANQASTPRARPRARDLGIVVGVLPPGSLNAITDVAGVRVGHATVIKADNVRTGVTAILPHPGNLFQEKVPAAIFVGNGFGKLMGSTQVRELGEIETPILLTSTLNVPRVADALLDWMLERATGTATTRTARHESNRPRRWFDHHHCGDRRSARLAQSRSACGTRDVRTCAHRIAFDKRQRGLCDCLQHGSGKSDSFERHDSTSRYAWQRNDVASFSRCRRGDGRGDL